MYTQKLKYAEHPDEVTLSRNNYVDMLLQQAQQNNIELQYTPRTLKRAVLKVTQRLHQGGSAKPTDVLTARTYVYNNLLSEEERRAIEADYPKNPEHGNAVAKKFAELVTQELVLLKLVEDTNAAKAQKILDIYQDKLERLHITYKPQ